MRKISLFILIGVFTLSAQPVYAEKGASETAQEKASDQAIFNRVGDWFATIGKSNEEKAKVKAERQAKRNSKKAEKEARKNVKEAEKAAKQVRDDVEGKKKKAEKQMKGSKKGSKKKGSKKKGSKKKGS